MANGIGTTSMSKARDAMARGDKHMGDLCWPEVFGVGEAVTRAELRQWLADEKLPVAMAKDDVTPRRAFGLALADCLSMPDVQGYTIVREAKRANVALIREHVGSGVRKETRTWAMLSVNESGSIDVTWNPDMTGDRAVATRCLDALTERYIRHRDYVCHSEVGTMAVDAILDYFGGVRMRRSGGVYYVPPSSAEQLRAFGRVMARVGDSSLPFLPIYDSDETVGTMGVQLGSELERQIEAVVESAKKLGGENGKARESSLGNRLEALEEIRNRSVACGVLLDAYRDRIENALETARGSIVELKQLDAA